MEEFVTGMLVGGISSLIVCGIVLMYFILFEDEDL